MADLAWNVWTFIVLVAGWSYLYKESDLFHFVEYSIIAVAVAHSFNSGFWFLIDNGLTPLLEGQIIYLVGFLLGFLTYFRFWRKYAWLMRYSIGLMTGTYIGLSIRGIVAASIIAQIVGSIQPLMGVTGLDAINHIILLTMLVGVMWYFIFSKRLSFSPGPYKYVSYIGRIGIVIVMAYYLATEFVGQQLYVFSRVEFVIEDFIGSIVAALSG